MSIIFDRVSFAYGRKAVLKEVSFELADRGRYCLMGASGSGKTTILRLLAGLEAPDRGSISGISGGGISFVFQENRLLPNLSVIDNLLFVSPGAQKELLSEYLGEVGLEGVAELLPAELSGGMARRVAIVRAVAFANGPLILDEPFSGLDVDSRQKTAEFILKHAKDRIILVVTHDPAEAELLGAQIVRLDDLNRI